MSKSGRFQRHFGVVNFAQNNDIVSPSTEKFLTGAGDAAQRRPSDEARRHAFQAREHQAEAVIELRLTSISAGRAAQQSGTRDQPAASASWANSGQ